MELAIRVVSISRSRSGISQLAATLALTSGYVRLPSRAQTTCSSGYEAATLASRTIFGSRIMILDSVESDAVSLSHRVTDSLTQDRGRDNEKQEKYVRNSIEYRPILKLDSTR